MTFEKDHLLSDYNWTDEPNSKIFTGTPTRRKFDRFNGHQVLFIINYYGSTLDSFSLEDGRSLENIIVNNLPLQPSSEITVVKWLDNFSRNEV